MTQQINPEKLKAAAEHLEWVCQQYPDNEDVQGLYHGLLPMIEEAKAGRVVEPVEKIPFGYAFGDGVFMPYKNPNVGDAYADFSTEMAGGLSEQEKNIIAKLEAFDKKLKNGGQS